MSRRSDVSPRMRGRLVTAVVATMILFSFLGATVKSTASSGTSLTLPTASQWSNLHGVNYGFNCPPCGSYTPNAAISFPAIKADNFNYVRFAWNWNSYAANPSKYVAYLQNVAWNAERNGVYVVFVMMDYGTGPQYGGSGFPAFVTAPYSTQRAFWAAWYAKSVTVSGTNGWDAYLKVWKDVISHVDNYLSVIGYEPMNEPSIFTVTSPKCNPLGQCNQFVQLGTLQTYLAAHIRAMTSKWILFARPYVDPSCTSCGSDQPTVNQMLSAAPNIATATKKGWGTISGIVFAPHRYAKSIPIGYMTLQKDMEIRLGSIEPLVPMTMGEWSIVGYHDKTWNSNETNFINNFIGELHRHGFAWTYEGWAEAKVMNPAKSNEFQYLLSATATTYSQSDSYCVSIGEFQAPCPLTVNQWRLGTYLAQVTNQVYGGA